MSDAFQFGLKVAEIMLPGAQPQNPGMGLSGLSATPSLPPITGPLRDDLSPGALSSALAKSMDPDPLTGAVPSMRLTDADVAHGKQLLADDAKKMWDVTTPQGRNMWLDWAANTKPVTAISNFGAHVGQTARNFPSAYGHTLRDYFQNGWRDAEHKTNTDYVARTLLGPARLTWNGLRGASWLADKTSELPENLRWAKQQTGDFFKSVKDTVTNTENFTRNLKELSDKARAANQTVSLSPEDAAAAASTSKPTMGSYLSDSVKGNPMWLLPAAGLGGLGVYGLYKALQARKDAKKRRRLMSPAAITY